MIQKLFSSDRPYWLDIFWEYQEQEIIKELREEYPRYNELMHQTSEILIQYPRLVKIWEDDEWDETGFLSNEEIKALMTIIQNKKESTLIYSQMMFLYGCRNSINYMNYMKKK